MDYNKKPNCKIEDRLYFRVKSKFNPLVVAYAYPVRLTGAFLVTLFILPELAKFFAWITGIGGFFSYFLAGILVFIVVLVGPFIMTWLDYRTIIYSFYSDRVEFLQGFWVRELLKIPYHGITDIEVSINKVQKKYKMGSIKLVAEPKFSSIKNSRQGHILPDIPNPNKVANNIKKLLAAYHKRQQEIQHGQ